MNPTSGIKTKMSGNACSCLSAAQDGPAQSLLFGGNGLINRPHCDDATPVSHTLRPTETHRRATLEGSPSVG